MRPIDADAAIDAFDNQTWERLDIPICKEIRNAAKETIRRLPTIDAAPVIRCKDCKHRPTIDGEYENGFDVIFPDMRCPCQCDDGWYNWMPKDDWYCGNAERKEE